MNHKLRSFSLLMVVTAMLVVAGSSLLLAQDDLVSMHSTDLLSDESIAIPTGDEVDTSAWAHEGPYTIGFINWSSANSWTQQVDAELAHEVSLYPEIEEFISLSADGDVNEQINQMEDLISLGVDAILVIPVAVEPLAPSIDLATENGIPVVVFAARSGSENNITTLLANQVNFGRVLGDFLMEQLDCQGNVIVLNGISGNSTSDDRRQGLTDAIAACPDGGAGVTILAEEDAQWAYDQGKLATERMLAAFPEIDGLFSQGGAMTQGAIDAFEAADRPLVPMTGEDNNGFMMAWQERAADGFVSLSASEPTWQGRLALQAALRALQGLPINSYYELQVPTITGDELDQYVRPNYSDSYWTNSMLPEDVADAIYMEEGAEAEATEAAS